MTLYRLYCGGSKIRQRFRLKWLSYIIAFTLVALTELGISPDDERFMKNGAAVEDVLLRFQLEDGSFAHTQDGGSDLTATTQALYALAAAQRQRDGKTTLYDMTEAP